VVAPDTHLVLAQRHVRGDLKVAYGGLVNRVGFVFKGKDGRGSCSDGSNHSCRPLQTVAPACDARPDLIKRGSLRRFAGVSPRPTLSPRSIGLPARLAHVRPPSVVPNVPRHGAAALVSLCPRDA
jgi:hypothetical protein